MSLPFRLPLLRACLPSMAFALLWPLLICAAWPISSPAQEQADFRKVDRRARRAPAELRTDLPALTDYLVEGLQTDTEKMRALYVWITHHIEYDREAYLADSWRINRSLEDILRRGRAICFGYARLLRAMSTRAGLRCEVVDGYSKGTLTAVPGLQEPDHSWNVARLDGRWRLLDATWGSSVIDRDNEFVTSDSAFYFLTPPRHFILNHLPAQPMWQLLPCPVPPEVFQDEPSRIQGWLNSRDSCFAYRDSIDAWLALPPERRTLARARTAYRFNPTAANATELGHALIDYAGRLSDRADSLQRKGRNENLIALQEEVIRSCEAARQYADTLYAWQHELCIGSLVNQAVALVQRANEEERPTDALYRRAIQYLEEARSLVRLLPSGSIYARQVAQQAETYLDMLQPYVEE